MEKKARAICDITGRLYWTRQGHCWSSITAKTPQIPIRQKNQNPNPKRFPGESQKVMWKTGKTALPEQSQEWVEQPSTVQLLRTLENFKTKRS